MTQEPKKGDFKELNSKQFPMFPLQACAIAEEIGRCSSQFRACRYIRWGGLHWWLGSPDCRAFEPLNHIILTEELPSNRATKLYTPFWFFKILTSTDEPSSHENIYLDLLFKFSTFTSFLCLPYTYMSYIFLIL